MPVNFIRHYYDIYKLLEQPIVKDFIGTSEYTKHKATRFTKSMLNNLQTSDAFFLRDPTVRERYRQQYERTNALYYNEFPDFDEILDRIGSFMPSL
jgi:transglutaminase-like putative cysteine protease